MPKGLFWRPARTRYRSRGDGGVATRGGRTFRGKREFGGKVAAALAREEERRAEAARRKRFSAGRVRGRGLGSDCRTAGSDLGGDGPRHSGELARSRGKIRDDIRIG